LTDPLSLRSEARAESEDPDDRRPAIRRPWSSVDDPALARRATALAIALAALLVLLATLARQTGVPKIDTIWADDGTVFLDCAYRRSFIECLATPYQGYLHLVPRVGAALAAAAPPAQASVVLVLLAALIGAAAAGLAARAIASATGSPLAAVIGGSGLGLVWQAGREVLGNLANLHWVLLAAALVVLACAWVGHRLDGIDAALVAVTGLSSGLAPLLVVVVIPAVILARPGARLSLSVAGATTLIQVAAELGATRQASGTTPLGLADAVGALGDHVLGTGFFGTLRTPPGWIVPVGILVTILIVGAASRARRRDAIPGIAVVVTLVAVGIGIFGASVILNRLVNPRYAYAPAATGIAALAVGSGLAARVLATANPVDALQLWLARLLVPAVALVLAFGFIRSFRLETRASDGPNVPNEIEAAAGACNASTSWITIPISPRPATSNWNLSVPCGRSGR